MDISENVLLSEIGRKIAMSSGDRQTNEFLRNQSRREQGGYQGRYTPQNGGGWQPPVAPPDDLFIDDVAADGSKPVAIPSLESGSSIEVLEFEILKYLLCNGHENIALINGVQVNEYNIASLIFSELEDGDHKFTNKVHDEILQLYRTEWERLGEGKLVAVSKFLESENPDVCNKTVDIITTNDLYIESKIWKNSSAQQNDPTKLSDGIIKAVKLYKSRILGQMIKELQQRLTAPNVPEDELMEIMKRLTKLNSIKVQIAKNVNRPKC